MYSELSVSELRALCAERQIAFVTRDRRPTLIGKLRERDCDLVTYRAQRRPKSRRRGIRRDIRRAKRRGRAATRAARARWAV